MRRLYKTEKTYEVLTNDGDATLGFIIAYNDDHASELPKKHSAKE